MKKDDIAGRRTQSLMLAAVWLGGLANVKMLRALSEQLDLPDLKKVHLDLFAYIDPDGTSITEIARRKGVTKQSISKTVQELLQMGFLQTRENPEDSRSKLVSFNLDHGSAMLRGFAVLDEIDQELAQQMGADAYQALLSSMQSVMQSLEAQDPAWSLLQRA